MVKSSITPITPTAHASSHSVGGTDPLVAPLLPHATNHLHGGSDELPLFDNIYNVTGSRANNTEYQNTQDGPMMVIVSGYGSPSPEYLQIYVGSSSPLGASDRIVASQTTDSFYIYASFIVPPGFYYKTAGLETDIAEWWEIY